MLMDVDAICTAKFSTEKFVSGQSGDLICHIIVLQLASCHGLFILIYEIWRSILFFESLAYASIEICLGRKSKAIASSWSPNKYRVLCSQLVLCTAGPPISLMQVVQVTRFVWSEQCHYFSVLILRVVCVMVWNNICIQTKEQIKWASHHHAHSQS